MTLVKFQVGQEYYGRSVCQSDATFTLTVASRTDKTIRTTEGKTLRIKILNGLEMVRPLGNYSMAPTIHAGSPN